jgi:serine/threonine-protein kinase HipA
VGVEVDGKCLQAGELHFEQIGKDFIATFTYHVSYLSLALEGRAFALDPINLPLRATPYVTSGRYEQLGVLFDAAPDAWGRTVMAMDEQTSVGAITEKQVLIKGRGMGVGAIFFSTQPIDDTFSLPHTRQNKFDDIAAIYEDVKKIEQGLTVDENRRLAFKDSWDIGGARPKAIVYDQDGLAWIAKFPRKIDTYSRQRVEWANLAMAKEIGMTVPPNQLFELPDGECAFLVQRFDRSYDQEPGKHGRRQHFLSAASLISPPHDFDKFQMNTPYGSAYFSYASIAAVIRKVSSHVDHDLQEIFARMVLNVMVNNTDDHLKNTGFMIDPSSKAYGLRLAPLFDVVTQEGPATHMLHIGPGVDPSQRYQRGRQGTIANILSGAKSASIKPQAASDIIDRVQSVLAHRPSFYEMAGMSEYESDMVETKLNKEIAQRISSRNLTLAPGRTKY